MSDPAPALQAVEFGLPHDGVRLRARTQGRFWSLVWIALLVGPSLSVIFLAGLAGGAPGLAIATVAAAVFAWLLAGFWRTRLATRELIVDRIGVWDSAAGVPAIPWTAIDAVDESPATNGGLWHASGGRLYVRLTAQAQAARRGGWRALYEWALAEELRAGVGLPATEALHLPVPFEYLVMLMRERGAPIRPHAPTFDPFEFDARWRAAPDAAAMIQTRLGPRARPFANHNLDIARSRANAPAIAHWEAVLAELRRMAGLVESPAEE
ncbi:MAG: hypothetical protein ACKOEE_03710 [Tagaea sp.]